VRPDLPPALAAILSRLLALRPADRYADADEVASALRPFARDAPPRSEWIAMLGPLPGAAIARGDEHTVARSSRRTVAQPPRGDRARAYLAALPGGPPAFTRFRQKAAVMRLVLGGIDLSAHVGVLGDEIARLVREPPPVNAWIPETHATAIYMLMADTAFISDEAFLADAVTRNRTLLNSAFYRVLFAVLSPKRVVRGAAERWSKLHDGSELLVERTEDRSCDLLLRIPEALLPPLMLRCYGVGFSVAGQLAGARDVRIEHGEWNGGGFPIRCTWR
jgi:hypothetical protein